MGSKIKLLLVLLSLSIPSMAADHFIACGTPAATVVSTINGMASGDTTTLQHDGGGGPGGQCNWDFVNGIVVTNTTWTSMTWLQSDNCSAVTPNRRVTFANRTLFARIRASGGFGNRQPILSSIGNAKNFGVRCLELTNTGTYTAPTDYIPFIIIFHGDNFQLIQNSIHPQECPNNTPPYNTSVSNGIQWGGVNLTIKYNSIICVNGTPPTVTAGNVATYGRLGSTGTIWPENGPCSDDGGVTGSCDIIDNEIEVGYTGIFSAGSDPPASDNNPGRLGFAGLVQASPAPTATSARLSSTSGLSPGMVINLPVIYDLQGMGHDWASVVSWNSGTSYTAGMGARGSNGLYYFAVNNNSNDDPTTSVTGNWQRSYCVSTEVHGWMGVGCWLTAKVATVVGNDVTWDTPLGWGWSGSGNGIAVSNRPPIVGAQAQWNGANVFNLNIKQNHIFTNGPFIFWMYANGRSWGDSSPKGYMELKSAYGLHVEYNVFDGGYPTTLSIAAPGSQYCSASWTQASDLYLRWNWVNDFSNSFTKNHNYEGYCINATPGHNWNIEGNVAVGAYDNPGIGAAADFITWGDGYDVHVKYNTILSSFNRDIQANQYCLNSLDFVNHGSPTFGNPSLEMKYNIFGNCNYGIQMTGVCTNLSTCWPNGVSTAKNLFVQFDAGGNSFPLNMLFSGNLTNVNGFSQVGFTNLGNQNLILLNTSPAYRVSDEMCGDHFCDIGADICKIQQGISPSDSLPITGGIICGAQTGSGSFGGGKLGTGTLLRSMLKINPVWWLNRKQSREVKIAKKQIEEEMRNGYVKRSIYSVGSKNITTSQLAWNANEWRRRWDFIRGDRTISGYGRARSWYEYRR